MTKTSCSFFLVVLFCMIPMVATARDITPVVSTDWLLQNSSDARLKMVDMRKVEAYKEGHIPGAVNVFMGAWVSPKPGLLLELPENDDLADTIKSAGINNDSLVVVIGATDNDFARADAFRVAWTLMMGGVRNVAVLDGGFNKWVREKKPLSTDQVKAVQGNYTGKPDRSVVVSKDYVRGKIGTAIILDSRNADDFYGLAKAPYNDRPGHIKGATNLPAPWLFTKEGLLRGKAELTDIVQGVAGKDPSKEIIVYCGVGGFASPMWYVLTEMLGYKNVKFYDGSIQDWSKDPTAPITRYSWQ
jgi:thiosulfate/3-mercaptopyruvate sulfurtransferase